MKKLVSVVLSLLLVFSFASAEVDLSSMSYAALSNEDLHAVINAARNELLKRELVSGEKTIIFDQDGVQVYLTGKNKAGKYLKLGAVLINNSDVTVSLDAVNNHASMNGWEVYCSADDLAKTGPGKKQKGDITLNAEDAEVVSLEDIEEIEFTFTLKNVDTRKDISTAPTVVVHYK